MRDIGQSMFLIFVIALWFVSCGELRDERCNARQFFGQTCAPEPKP